MPEKLYCRCGSEMKWVDLRKSSFAPKVPPYIVLHHLNQDRNFSHQARLP